MAGEMQDQDRCVSQVGVRLVDLDLLSRGARYKVHVHAFEIEIHSHRAHNKPNTNSQHQHQVNDQEGVSGFLVLAITTSDAAAFSFSMNGASDSENEMRAPPTQRVRAHADDICAASNLTCFCYVFPRHSNLITSLLPITSDMSIQLPNTFAKKKPQSSATLTDLGYSHMPRGWYDAQGSGFSIDYGRYVGDGNAANPIRWAVALAGKTD
eukprot:scaffold3195_cov72-Skeletonema_dohrnii-CCMP3373.AAC.1